MASKRFGWHSGTLKCEDAKIQGDLYIQDDIIFSDVSAGQLGVTGSIDFSSATVPSGADNALIKMGSWNTALAVTATDHTVPLQINLTNSGNVQKDIACARLKTSTGAAQALAALNCVELRQTVAHNIGQLATLQASASFGTSTIGLGEAVVGYFSLEGAGNITPAGANGISALVATFQNTGTVSGTNRNVAWFRTPASVTVTNMLKIDNVGTTTNGLYVTGAGTTTNAINVDAASTTAISLSGDATTGISITSGMSATNMISLAGSASGSGIAISGACGTGVYITGACTTGLYLNTGTFTTGISLAGTLGTGLAISACTTAIDINGSATTGISITGAMANPIVITPATAATCALTIGTSISDGMTMTGTKNGMVRAFGQIKTTEALSNDIRGIWGRVRQDADVDLTGGYQVCGIQGSAKLYGGSAGTTTTLWSHSGLYGSFETDGVATSNVASTGYVSGVIGVLGMGAEFTISSGATAAALRAKSNCNASMTATGNFAGLYMDVEVGCKAFTTGIQIPDSVATTGISIGACTTGVLVSGTGATASARAFKGAMTINNGNYGDGYGMIESEMNLTGTTAGHTSALSAWINIGSGVATGLVCAQTNGVWEDSATISGATVIFGMRMQSLCTQAPGESYPFSIVSNTNVVTALIQCNDASSDLGRITNAGTDNGTLVPLYKDNTGVKYVKIYTAV